ncbi:MAG: sialidase family protein [Limnochordia bacterium]|jgi:hypothetical protein
MTQSANPLSTAHLIKLAEAASVKGRALPWPVSFVHSTGWESLPTPCSEENREKTPVVVSSRHVAFPGICRTNQGRLLVVYRDGLTHAGGQQLTDGRVMMAESLDGGHSWSQPWLIYDDPSLDDRNSALMCAADGRIVHVWNKYWQAQDFGVFLATSSDEGRAWTSPVRIGENALLRTRSSPLEAHTSDGRVEWLVPMYDCISTAKAAYLGIFHPEDGTSEVLPVTPVGQRNVSDEWALTQAADGRLVALIRSNTDPFLWQTESYDGGRSWQPPRPSSIPSQSTPPDIIRLHDGRLLVTFSFRERRNERQVVSEDHGASWQVVSSIDVFDASLSGDRSYPAATQIDSETVGTVLYETMPAPQGGIIWFARTRLSDLKRPPVSAWRSKYSPTNATAFLDLPHGGQGVTTLTAEYRFTGEFGTEPGGFELVLQDRQGRHLRCGYWMGGGLKDTNHVQISFSDSQDEQVLLCQGAIGDLYNDGNDHRLAVVYEAGRVALAIDGLIEAVVDLPAQVGEFQPHLGGISARWAAVAVYGFEVRGE